jgi:phosphoenolpyruvate-protein phosphotransferase (PTS system enzyme I)
LSATVSEKVNSLKKREILKGEKISGGIGIGRLFYIDRQFSSIPHYALHPSKEVAEKEILRFKIAIDTCSEELLKIQGKKNLSHEALSILEVHRMMITDPVLFENVLEEIEKNKINAEWAVLNVFERLVDILASSGADYYIKAKIADMEVVRDKILSQLMDRKKSASRIADLPEEDFILCAHSLTVSDLNALAGNSFLKGIVLEIPGGVSHLAVVLRTLEIPAVMGVHTLITHLDYSDEIIVDGQNGEVILRPGKKEISEALGKLKVYEEYFSRFLENIQEPSVSKDGTVLKIGGNIEHPDETDLVKKYGGEFVGLFRTELLFIDRKEIPTEEEHYLAYYETLHRLFPMRVTIRIFDFGGDKEGNIVRKGSMGMRGIRFCKKYPAIFLPQIRGLIRVASLGNLDIMLPFVSNVHEVDDFRELIYKEAREMGLEDNLKSVRLGAMIEVPAALFISEMLAKEVDFFSVGTNDLIQYMMAVERKDKSLSNYFSHFDPSIVRALYNLSHIAGEQNIEISICGEMGGDPFFALVFLGMGFTSLSMSPINIPIIKKIIKSGYLQEGKKMLNDILIMPEKELISSYLEKEMTKKYPNIFRQIWTNKK